VDIHAAAQLLARNKILTLNCYYAFVLCCAYQEANVVDDIERRFRDTLETVEQFIRDKDFYNAHQRLLSASRQFLAERYPYEVAATDSGASISFNGYALGVLSAVVHGLIRGRTNLEDIQRLEIGKVLAGLSACPAKLRILVVRDLPIKHAIIRDLDHELRGVEVWTADDLCRLELPIRG
jgi:hypothetical protein